MNTLIIIIVIIIIVVISSLQQNIYHIHTHIYTQVRKLLTKDPKKRITIQASLKHPWLTSADEEFKNNNMKKAIDNMKVHMAKIRFKKSVKAVIFMRRCKKSAIMGNIMKSLEDARKIS